MPPLRRTRQKNMRWTHSFQNASAVSEKRLKAEALKYAVGSVLPEDVADIAQHPEVIAETKRRAVNDHHENRPPR